MSKTKVRLKEFFPHSVFVPVGAAGFLLSLALGWAIAYFVITRDSSVYPREHDSSRFARELQRYDAPFFREANESTVRLLRQLERRAGTQAERLSVLKRWRILAGKTPALLPGYESAVIRALDDFPYSENLAAVAIEAVFMYGGNTAALAAPLQDYAKTELLAAMLNRERFPQMILSYHVLSGNLRDASGAASIPGIGALLSAEFSQIGSEAKADLVIDGILLRILRGDLQTVPLEINNLIAGNPENRDALRLGAGYFYDHGNALNSALLFSRLGDTESLSREADALALADEVPAARNILTVLASPSAEITPEAAMRLFYNLAATSENESEEMAWLNRMLAGSALENPSQAEVFGMMRYTRLHDTERSTAILEGGSRSPLLDLELFRRRMDTWLPDRWVPEIWLLLGRHPEAEELYRWGAAFFDTQKLYDESAQLLRVAANQRFEGGWLYLHRGLALIREGKHEEGESLLREALRHPINEPWLVYANLGRLNESRRSIAAAAENYETAASLAGNIPEAIQIQLYLSRCYESLGRFSESRDALDRAFEMEPENINVRHELGRLGTSGAGSAR